MYSQFKAICSQKPSQTQSSTQTPSMKKFVETSDTEELCQMVLKVLNTTEVVKMLHELLKAFQSTSEKFHDKRMKLVKSVFDALRNAKATNKHVDDVVNRIMIDFHSFSRSHLAKLVDYCIERIRNNDDDFMSWKDVLPVLIEKLEDEKSINFRGTDISGQDYKITILRSICEIDWDTKILTSLAKMFVEILADMKDKQINILIMKALTHKLMSMELTELPPLTHQLLKLGTDYNSTLLFTTLSRYFSQMYASLSEENDSEDMVESIISSNVTLKELQDVESTVLYIIYQSALDSEKGVKEYMKCLKLAVNVPEYIMEPFVMSVLLQLADLYEDLAFPILKSAVLRQIQDEEHQNNSAWLRSISHTELSTFEVINRVIESSNKDRQLVLKGMVDFAFVLLGFDRKASNENHLAWDFGCKIVQKIARKRDDAGATILDILVGKIVSCPSSVTQYTDCLEYMCRKLTMIVIDHQASISTLLDHILEIPATTATQVLRAILPLMRISSSIRDNLIMVLRKALYRRGVQTRQMAVLGFLQLLKNLKLATLNALSQSESSSSNAASSSSFFTQATLERPSQRSSSNPWHNTSLCRELLSILTKCFSHEAEVRSHLYQELYYGIVKNAELTDYVVEMLLEHFSEFYEKDEDILPPLNFDKCGSLQGIDVVLQEPLADLVFALQKIYLKVASKESAAIDKLAQLLESLCTRMSQTDLEHLSAGEEIDLSDNMPKSQQKILNIKLTISIYEALIAFRIGSWSQNSENVGQSIISLYKGYLRFVEYIKRLSKMKKGGKGKKDKDKDKDGNDTTFKKPGRPTVVKMPNTVMDFDTISKSLVLLYDPSNPWSTEEQASCLRGRIEFHLYILQTCLQLLQNVKILKDHELKNCLDLNKQNFFTIGKTLYTRVVSELKNVTTFNPVVAVLGVECFKECCEIKCNLYSSELPGFLETTCGADPSQSLPLKIQSLIKPLKDVFIASLTEEDKPEDLSAQCIPRHLIDVIDLLIKKVTFDGVKAEKVFNWLIKVAEEHEQIDIEVASKIIQLILLIEDRSMEYGETMQEICVEFATILGRVDKTEVTNTRKFQIINEDNAHNIYIAVNKLLSLKIQNVVWMLGTLTAEHTAMSYLEADNEKNRQKMKDKEQSLCRQFAHILSTFEILANVKIEPGPASDAIFKNIQKVYNFASSLTKYFKKKSTDKSAEAFQSAKFIPVIQGAGIALKQAIMELIPHVESTQNSGKSNDARVQRNKILKEMMVIPGVVQAMETFDKEVVLLSKKTGVELLRFTHFDAGRDFRIKDTQFKSNCDKLNTSLGFTQTNRSLNQTRDQTTEESNDESDTRSEGDESPRNQNKKRRLS